MSESYAMRQKGSDLIVVVPTPTVMRVCGVLISAIFPGVVLAYGINVGLLSGMFVPIGLWLALPEAMTSTFDLRQRRVASSTLIGSSRFWSYLIAHRAYSFDEIAAIGVAECNHCDNPSYYPALLLRDGTSSKLATHPGLEPDVRDLADQICKATGIARSDFKIGQSSMAIVNHAR